MIAHSVAEQLRLIDRAVTTLTRSTEALLRATDETSLLDDICRIAVEMAGYRLAWIGYARLDENKSVVPMAQAGVAGEYVRNIAVTWGDTDLGNGPTGRAIRTGLTQIVRNTEGDERYAPWRETGRRFGFGSAIALPLGQGEERIGALNIYAAEPDAFDADVIRVLEDLARNLTYGIGALRMKVEHDQAVNDLAESEERYRSLIELSPDAIIVHTQGTILFANRAAGRTLAGGNAVMLVGRNMLDLIAPDHRAEIGGRILHPPTSNVVTEHGMLRLDGSPFDAEVVATTITFHGLPAKLLVIRDITERKLVQEQLVQTAKLATLGEMAAGLVHELSQPLNIMRLTAEGALMLIGRGKATPEWQVEQFQVIADQAQRTAEIIDDIRIFSRRDTSPVLVFDALQAVRAAVGVLEGQLRPDGIAVVLDLPGRAVPVRGRPIQLEQVVMNLLSNAHHALRDKRETMMLADEDWEGEVRVRARRKDSHVEIVVQDNGPGLSPEIRARIFEPFFTTKEAGRGTGLGLSVSFGIVNSMGGRFEVLTPKKGAAFAVILPIAEDADMTERDAAPPPAPLPPSDAHILVVDDEGRAAEILARHLEALGYRASVCTNGGEAFTKFMEDPADVVVTDLRMPAGGGEQLVEKLRDYDPLLPIVIVTGHLGATERLAANLEDDRCAILKKPVALTRLGEIISTFLLPPSP